MIERALRTASLVASALVIIGFAFFAIDQTQEASERSRDRIAGIREADPPPDTERRREREHSAVREFVDDANDLLLKPFAQIVTSKEPWVNRGLPALMALAVYGFGLGYLASYARGRLA